MGCYDATMNPADDATAQLQSVIDRLRAGDQSARRELLDRACHRLRRLVARVLHGSFPAQRSRHEVDSIVHETWIRLLQALETTNPPTVQDFFRLAAHKVRQVLLDMTERQRRDQLRQMPSGSAAASQESIGTYDPSTLAMWTEFHRQAALLPEAEREIFEMHYYLDLPQAEIARVLDLHPRKVSYLWIAATERLFGTLGDGKALL